MAAPYFNHTDSSGAFTSDRMAYVRYNQGPLQAGVLACYGNFHIGPEAQLRNTTTVIPLAQDSDYFHGTAYTKINNGRFFFNAEAAWLYWTDRLSGPAVFTSYPQGSGQQSSSLVTPTPRYTQQWRYMAEAGVMTGPAKFTVITAWSPGPDRRNGALIDRQSAAFVWHPTYDAFLGNYDVFRPYSFLLTYNYGSGLNAHNLSSDGYLRDAWILAGRLDHALAANLNEYATFLWAQRTSNGYGWGCIAPNNPIFFPLGGGPYVAPPGPQPTPWPQPQFLVPGVNDGNVLFQINGNSSFLATAPNIPDTALGWEATAGADWQLLDGLTAGLLVAYWQPGRWFSYACIDRSVDFWWFGGVGSNFGTKPAKEIDPILGGQFTLSYSF